MLTPEQKAERKAARDRMYHPSVWAATARGITEPCCGRKVLSFLTTLRIVGIIANMKATLLLKERLALDADSFAASLVWQVPRPVTGSTHLYKYSLAYVVRSVCLLRYDNERGKGDHKHLGEVETAYVFTTPEQLLADFWSDVDQLRREP
jgi:hypothetical protein